MKCKNYLFSVLFAFLGIFFGSFIINQNDTYALSYSYTIDANNLDRSDKCQGSFDCSSPFYAIIDFVSSTPVTGQNSFFVFNSYYSFYPYYTTKMVFYFVNTSSFSLSTWGGLAGLPSGYSLNITLQDDNPFSGSAPSGSLEIIENGIYDVSQYAEAVVNVPETDCPPSSGGDYHNDLVAINNSIMICAATCLVIYFFYCIYRMIIKNSGVK